MSYVPLRLAAASNTIVISEFRTRGPNGASDEFVELFNASSASVSIGGWELRASNGSGTVTTRATINAGTLLNAGCHYLLTNSNPSGGPFSGGVGDQTYGVSITDDGGLGLVTAGGVVIDQVGMSSGSFYKEGSTLDPLTTNTNRSYERRPGGAAGSAQDTDNNRSDFRLLSPSDPQRVSSLCLSAGTPSSPTGVGAAAPSSVAAGAVTLLTVSVSPGSNPTSTGLFVTGNLGSIGGSSSQVFFDDGTNGDVTAADNRFSFQGTIGAVVSPGAKSLSVAVGDAQGRSSATSIALTVESPGSGECGVERWSIKTGTDSDALLVNLNKPVPTTIGEMRSWSIPNPIPLNNRAEPRELTLYAVSGTLTDYKREDDSDYHLVIRDQAGNSIITEIPCPCCVAASSPFLEKTIRARSTFESRLMAKDTFQTTSIPVVIRGIGFFDFIHGQRGVAPNGIELHPVLDLSFDIDSGTPVIVDVVASGKKLFIYGLNFDEGAVLLRDGEQQKTRNDDESVTLLIAKKAAKSIAPGDTVKLQVRNANGRLSGEFSFTRPMEPE